MAGSVTFTGSVYDKPVKKLVMNWVSDASGNVNTVPTTEKFTGRLICAQHVPSTTVAPTTLYDVTVLDDQGTDILAGTGADVVVPGNKSSQAVSSGLPLPSVVDSTLSLNITNAGNAKQGKVILYFEFGLVRAGGQ